jgi:hypothetical protein
MAHNMAKPIVAILTAEIELLREIVSSLEKHLGATDVRGSWHPFVHTDYYADEMGENLRRCIVSFERPISADELPQLKAWTREIEDKYRVEGRRKVNIDPGYVDLHKVVLGSGKGGGHMILVGRGVSADILLYYNKGWQPLPWAYPDFRDGTYFEELELIRRKFKSSG